VVYEPVTNNPVYDLLDELAALKVITFNSVVKPYSRLFIANKLNQARQNPEKLNKRQLAEVEFYLKDYGFDLTVTGRWSLVTGNDYQTRNMQPATGSQKPETSNQQPATSKASFNLNPISFRLNTNVLKMSIVPQLGARFIINENGNFLEVLGGGEVYGYLTKHIGYYVNMNYIHQSQPLVNPMMLTMEEGKSWSYLDDGSVYNTELRGGLSVGWNWGDFGIYKDRPVWGNANHGSNIMSGHPPSFPYIQLHLKPAKWIEFYCITGFLKSNVIDSGRSSFNKGSEQIKYHNKYFSANFFTITPLKGLDLSFGNSIFWSDVFKVGYLMPFNLYKSVDQTLKGSVPYNEGVNTNDDGHLFLDISSRNIKHVQLYLGWWIDDWVSSYLLDPDLHNAFGWKLGTCIYDLPLKNLSINIEGSINRPRIYHEYVPAHTYANEDYNFGNYLRDDSWEIFICAGYKPIRGLNISASYNLAQKGGFRYNIDDYTTYPLSKDLIYNRSTFVINGTYRITTNLIASLGYSLTQYSGDVQLIPGILHGETNSFVAGISLGF
jgi:hypothetical protein